MTDATRCDACGAELLIGDFPFCPHGPTEVSVVGDDVPGGFIAENGFDEPRKFYSKSEHQRALAERGLEIRAKHAGEHERHLTRWDTVDLDAAAALVSRGAEARERKRRRFAEEVPAEARIPVTITKADLGIGFSIAGE